MKILSALRTMVDAVRADHRMLHHYDGRYGGPGSIVEGGGTGVGEAPDTGIARDLVVRVGFQMLAAYRAMRFCVDAEIPLAPQIASRVIRHAYGSDIHWDAEFEPGVVIVHGMGMAISREARVKRGAILFQHVTLGLGVDPKTRESGAPTIEADTHVGAGSTLVGPITIGARSKITANCFVRDSVPADSLVDAGSPSISTREQARRTKERR